MIFSNSSQKNIERLQNVLISDKQFSPDRVQKVLKSDTYNLLNNYCNLQPENLDVKITVQKNGDYVFSITAVSNRLKIFGSLPDNY